jgi:hypothetical protein
MKKEQVHGCINIFTTCYDLAHKKMKPLPVILHKHFKN